MSQSFVVRLVVLCALCSFAFAATACGGSDPVPQQNNAQQTSAPKDRSIVMYQFKFNPNTLTIPAGTKVTFQNKDPERHNVNIAALNVDHNVDPNQSWSHTFSTKGEFAVSNRFSQAMSLTLIVE
ncbi:MAG: cupredoxin domain-containing protein [Bradymonadaceae bacterium]|nr:cupredoxin domain-containing protein [Lujinxingiaceae bacterium]